METRLLTTHPSPHSVRSANPGKIFAEERCKRRMPVCEWTVAAQ